MKRCKECECLLPDDYEGDICPCCIDDRAESEEDNENCLTVVSLFSGIGAFEKALENLKIPHKVLAYCEIDKYASKAYSAIHGIPESLNLTDVTKVDALDIIDTVDLITYGFPCQDISNAGKQKGFTDEDGKRTRSGLFFEALRIIDDYRPKFAIAENVKALVSKKFTEEFKTVLESLEEVGYNNYYAVLNAKDFGIPQNRERVFIISIRKDIDRGFTFPEPIPLTLRLKDMLDEEVDESFYLSEERIDTFIEYNRRNEERGNGFRAIFRDDTDISCALTTSADRSDSPYLKVKEATVGDSVNLEQPNSKTRRGRVGKGVAQTLTCSCNQATIIGNEAKGNGTKLIEITNEATNE